MTARLRRAVEQRTVRMSVEKSCSVSSRSLWIENAHKAINGPTNCTFTPQCVWATTTRSTRLDRYCRPHGFAVVTGPAIENGVYEEQRVLIDSLMAPSFDFQPHLSSVYLGLKPLEEDDLEALYLAASFPETWAGHPSKDRYRREVFEPYARTLMESGGTLAVIDRSDNRIVGCSRFYVSPDHPESISIGFTFLHHTRWGGRTNFELKRLMLDHAFGTFFEVWFHISPMNIRSQRATRKLGAEYMGDAVLDLSGQAALWMSFCLSKESWERTCRDRQEAGGP